MKVVTMYASGDCVNNVVLYNMERDKSKLMNVKITQATQA